MLRTRLAARSAKGNRRNQCGGNGAYLQSRHEDQVRKVHRRRKSTKTSHHRDHAKARRTCQSPSRKGIPLAARNRLTITETPGGAAFAAYVEKVLVPDLSPGTVVILDNLATHRNVEAEQAMRRAGCWFLKRFTLNLTHPTLPEIIDFNVLDDIWSLKVNEKRSKGRSHPPAGTLENHGLCRMGNPQVGRLVQQSPPAGAHPLPGNRCWQR